MRIGTWNLEGNWSADHARAMSDLNCDIWLISAVRPRVSLVGFEQHVTEATYADGEHVAGILARRPITPEPDPHPATALGLVGDVLVASSVFPWPLLDDADAHLWPGESHIARATATLDAVAAVTDGHVVLWGGAWHQPLSGNIVGYSRPVQEEIGLHLGALGLRAPTGLLRGRGGMQSTTDHIAVPVAWLVNDAGTVESEVGEHDLYWVDASPIL